MRRRRLRWGLLLGLGLGLACQGRLADLEQEERFVFCAGVNGARVIEEDGDHFRPWPPDEDPRPCGSESASGCGMDSDSPQYEQP